MSAGLKIVAPEIAVLHVGHGSQAPTQVTGRIELFLPAAGQIGDITVELVGTISGRVGYAFSPQASCQRFAHKLQRCKCHVD